MHFSEGHASLNGYGERDFRRTSLPSTAGHGCLALEAIYKREPTSTKPRLHSVLSTLSKFSPFLYYPAYFLSVLLTLGIRGSFGCPRSFSYRSLFCVHKRLRLKTHTSESPTHRCMKDDVNSGIICLILQKLYMSFVCLQEPVLG